MNPISLRQVKEIEVDKTYPVIQAPPNWLSTLSAKPGFQKALQISLNVFIALLFIYPVISRAYFDIQFAFNPDDDFGMTLFESFLGFLWFIFLLCGCTATAGLKSFKKAFLLFIVCIACSFFVPRYLHIGDYIRMATQYERYTEFASKAPNTRQEFNWGHYGFVTGPSGYRTLVYDPKDTLPIENKIKDYNTRKKFNHFKGTHVTTKHLYGHFYVVDEVYY